MFKSPIPSSIRVWHWLNTVLIFLLLGTVLVGYFFLKGKTNAPIIQASLAKSGTVIDVASAKSVAKTLSKPIWQWHKYLGFSLSALLIIRLGFELFTKNENMLFSKLIGWKTIFSSTSSLSNSEKHFIWVKFIYVVFYLCLSLIMSTGLLLAFDDDLGIEKELKTFFKEVHYYTMYYIIAFIVIHLIGVFRSELTHDRGIVSGMIHGNKPSF
ncbi:MAG: cytochrome b/b6 domain-containing protein [Cytophagales bacterium]|nr:cytochrome b/b6 domain-containing protein [Cytophagales bacterium]